MSCTIIIPVRPSEEGKTRLAPSLGIAGRSILSKRMFAHVLDVATRSIPASQVWVISRSEELLSEATACGARALREASSGQNSALAQAAERAPSNHPVMALSADLPFLCEDDIHAMVDALASTDVVAATDRRGEGTNALLLRQPGLIPFAFGEGSLARHRRLSQDAAIRFAVMQRLGLSTDIDVPDDMALLGDVADELT